MALSRRSPSPHNGPVILTAKPIAKVPSAQEIALRQPHLKLDVPGTIASKTRVDNYGYVEKHMYNVMRVEDLFIAAPNEGKQIMLEREVNTFLKNLKGNGYDALDKWKAARIRNSERVSQEDLVNELGKVIESYHERKKKHSRVEDNDQKYWMWRVINESQGYPTRGYIEQWKKFFNRAYNY